MEFTDGTQPGSSTYLKVVNGINDTPTKRMDTLQESVDLLQMVPQSDCTKSDLTASPKNVMCKSPEHTSGISPTHSCSLSLDSNARKGRFVIIPGSDAKNPNDSDSGIHSCPGCKSCGVYYERSRGASAANINWPPNQDEGSIYFNYIQFAKSPKKEGPKPRGHYEPVYRSALPQPSKQPSSSVFGCFKSKASPHHRYVQSTAKTTTTYQFTAPMCNDDNDSYANSCDPLQSDQPRTKRSPARQAIAWKKFRKLLILAAIGTGLVLALGGMVLGFIVLGPLDQNSEMRCISGYMPCGSKGCVNIQHYCSGFGAECPNVKRAIVCSNGTLWVSPAVSTATMPAVKYTVNVQPVVTLPSTPTPTSSTPTTPSEEQSRWVRYSGGSVNGSKYTIINSAMTFYGAQEECRKLGGYSAHVNTIREQVFLMEYLQQKLSNSDISQDGVGFWLGARRARGSHSGTCMYDQWKWVDPYNRPHGVISGFTAFVPGKPDNYFSPEECLYLTYNYQADEEGYLKWDDAPCDIHSVGGVKVLCEVELHP